jgi:hypothetical protein
LHEISERYIDAVHQLRTIVTGDNDMSTKQTILMQYDQDGDLHITIPRGVLKKFEESGLFQAIRGLQKDAAKRRRHSWEGDSISRIIGMAHSGISDGSLHHDLYLYGDGK